jgi:tellurite resistance protein TerC
MVEVTDVVFALDSIPAVLAVTTDPFIVYTSNVFAILGLRSLFFALSGLMGLFHYLRYGLAVVLVFIGMKMLLSDVSHIPVHWALAVVLGVLLLSVLASLIYPVPEASVSATDDFPKEV